MATKGKTKKRRSVEDTGPSPTGGGSRHRRIRRTTDDEGGTTTTGGEGGGAPGKKAAKANHERVSPRKRKTKTQEDKPKHDKSQVGNLDKSENRSKNKAIDKSVLLPAATCMMPVDAAQPISGPTSAGPTSENPEAIIDPERDLRPIDGKDPENMTESQMRNLRAFVTQYEQLGVKRLLEEFESIKNYNIVPFKVDGHEGNPTKNRYKDIYCIDATRIILKGKKKAEYIHANHVKGEPFLNTFVTTQGPIEGTVNDFWRLVVQEKVGYIFMLCSFIELEKKKCEQYYPLTLNETVKYGDISVTLVNTHSDAHFVNSKFELVAPKQANRFLYHHYWKEWPDHGVPLTAMAGLRLLRHARLTNYATMVHCSAGVGRTGTLVAIEWMLQKIITSPPPYDMKEMLKKMRDQRAHAIQTAPQYAYIVFAIYRLLATKDSSSVNGFQRFSLEMQEHTGVKIDGGAGPTKTAGSKAIPTAK